MLRSIFREIFHGRHRLDANLAEWSEQPYYDPEALGRRLTAKARVLQDGGYQDYPAIVHLETLAVCNAACVFCPYPTLERKGTRMSDALIEKVIGDLAQIPRDLPFQFAPYKVSDPFLEPRLFDIISLAGAKLPSAQISLITNGAALIARKIERLQEIRSFAYLNISLNYDNREEYEENMRIPFDRTLSRLDPLHERKSAGDLTFKIRLTRVSSERSSDLRFLAWARARYPAFEIAILPRNDWLGETQTGIASSVPDVPCHRWFDLSITATGIVAMCCMDGQAQYPKGDVNTQHALEIYNQPWLRELRRGLKSRRASGAPCDRCTYLSY